MISELESLPDDKLSEVFAVEVAGWREIDSPVDGRFFKDKEGAWQSMRYVHRFATSADAVLPFLDAWDASKEHRQDWHFYSNPDTGPSLFLYRAGIAVSFAYATFARAACICLIKAKRAEKGAK